METTSTFPTNPSWRAPADQAILVPTRDAALTVWENVARTRWGQYMTAMVLDAILRAETAFPTPGAALEVGCDGGRWCHFLSQRGWRMTATDTNPQALDLCRTRYPTVECILVSPSDKSLPVDSQTMELLLCLEVPDIASEWFLPEARRVLKPGGILVGVVMNHFSWRGLTNSARARLTGFKFEYPGSYASFRRRLRSESFRLRESRGCCWAPFTRTSNSRWIPFSTMMERVLGLHRITVLSPRIIFSASRT
jgi:SAM-dependent methyltransferase